MTGAGNPGQCEASLGVYESARCFRGRVVRRVFLGSGREKGRTRVGPARNVHVRAQYSKAVVRVRMVGVSAANP
jgi:hypothetical protein